MLSSKAASLRMININVNFVELTLSIVIVHLLIVRAQYASAWLMPNNP